MKPIQEFSDDDLIEELMARYDDIIIGARRILTQNGDQKTERRRWWKGDMDSCLGLINGVAMDVLHKIYGGSQDDIRIH